MKCYENYKAIAAMTKDETPKSAHVPKTQADRRRERAAQKLRENLQRRKQQVRARRAGQADETSGLPALDKDQNE